MATLRDPTPRVVVGRLGNVVGGDRGRPRRTTPGGQRFPSGGVRRTGDLHQHLTLGGISLNGSSVVGARATHDAQDVITDSTVTELADELWEADRKAEPIQPLTDRYPDLVI